MGHVSPSLWWIGPPGAPGLAPGARHITPHLPYLGRALSSARAVCVSSLGGQVLLPHPLLATGPAEALSSLAPLLLHVGDVLYSTASRTAD